MIYRCVALFACIYLFASALPARAQSMHQVTTREASFNNLKSLDDVTAISGYEKPLVEQLSSQLALFHPQVDNLGDVVVTLGSGAPHRLLVTGIDEPGFVVSAITDDGYLRVQRLPQGGLPPMFNELYSAQPVKIGTTTGGWIDGVVAGLSVHLAPGRVNPPKSNDLDEMYIDIGAFSADEVRKAGVDVLSPIAITRSLFNLAGAEFARRCRGRSLRRRSASRTAWPHRSGKTERHAHHCLCCSAAHRRARFAAHPHHDAVRRNDLRGPPVRRAARLPARKICAARRERNRAAACYLRETKPTRRPTASQPNSNSLPTRAKFHSQRTIRLPLFRRAISRRHKCRRSPLTSASPQHGPIRPLKPSSAADFDNLVKLLADYTQASGKSSFKLDNGAAANAAERQKRRRQCVLRH